jgi:hypothetical protein
MPTVNQVPEKLMAKKGDIEDLQILLDRRGMNLRVLVADDSSNPELKTLETLEKMKKQLVGIFDFFGYTENVGKTVAVTEGLQKLLTEAMPGDLIGCLDDNEHFFISALDLIEQIDKGYLGSIGTISYPDSILNQIDRHAMLAVGAIESQIMNLKGSLCIYASGYWIQHVEIVKIALRVYFLYQKKFREIFPNEIIRIPKWGTPTLLQNIMTWVIRTQKPWSNIPEEFRRLAVCYLPCKEIPAETPLGRSMEKVLNQLRALVLNGLILDELLGEDRKKHIEL